MLRQLAGTFGRLAPKVWSGGAGTYNVAVSFWKVNAPDPRALSQLEPARGVAPKVRVKAGQTHADINHACFLFDILLPRQPSAHLYWMFQGPTFEEETKEDVKPVENEASLQTTK